MDFILNLAMMPLTAVAEEVSSPAAETAQPSVSQPETAVAPSADGQDAAPQSPVAASQEVSGVAPAAEASQDSVSQPETAIAPSADGQGAAPQSPADAGQAVVAVTPANQGSSAQSAPPQSSLFMFVWLGLMIVLFYFMLIRPQKRREKERQALLAAIKTGDRVLFAGGMLGTVANVKDRTLVVKIADGVKVEVLRGAISQVLGKGEDPAEGKAP